jgi:hypothetical protein
MTTVEQPSPDDEEQPPQATSVEEGEAGTVEPPTYPAYSTPPPEGEKSAD